MATHKPVIVDELYGALTAGDRQEKWQVIHSKPQCEKKLADYLKRNSMSYYLPQLESVRLYKYRKVIFTKPMFPGYVFARFKQDDKPMIVISGYVVNILKVPDELELVDELNQIYLGHEHKAEYAPAKFLDCGWEVEITNGPLQGMQGIVQSRTRLNEVVLQVNILRQAVIVKVNPADVRVLKEFRATALPDNS